MIAALLPCPFCGHEHPEFERMGDRRQSCIVICGNCGARHESGDEGSRNGSSWNQRSEPGQDGLRATLETALARIEDMLADDDGQAFKEARKFLESARPLTASPTAQPASVCPRCGAQGVALFSRAVDGDELETVHCGCLHAYASPTAPSTEHKQLFGEMIAAHPGLREEIEADAVEAQAEYATAGGGFPGDHNGLKAAEKYRASKGTK